MGDIDEQQLRHQSGKTYSLVEMKFRRDKNDQISRNLEKKQKRQYANELLDPKCDNPPKWAYLIIFLGDSNRY